MLQRFERDTRIVSIRFKGTGGFVALVDGRWASDDAFRTLEVQSRGGELFAHVALAVDAPDVDASHVCATVSARLPSGDLTRLPYVRLDRLDYDPWGLSTEHVYQAELEYPLGSDRAVVVDQTISFEVELDVVGEPRDVRITGMHRSYPLVDVE